MFEFAFQGIFVWLKKLFSQFNINTTLQACAAFKCSGKVWLLFHFYCLSKNKTLDYFVDIPLLSDVLKYITYL